MPNNLLLILLVVCFASMLNGLDKIDNSRIDSLAVNRRVMQYDQIHQLNDVVT